MRFLALACMALAASASAANVEKGAPAAGAQAGPAAHGAAAVLPGPDVSVVPGVELGGAASVSDSPASAAALTQAVASGQLPVLERAASAAGRRSLLRVQDQAGRVQVAAMQGEGVEAKATIWADFFEGDRQALRDALVERLGVQAGDGPRITKTYAHLTAHSMEGEAPTRLYAGDGVLVTTHGADRASVEKTMRLLEDAGRPKSAKQLLGLVMADVIRSYGETIETLAADFHAMREKLDGKSTDDSVLQDSVRVGQKIDRMHETVQKQKRELQELLAQDDFHDSPHVPVGSLHEQIKALDHHLTILDHYQDRKNGLIDLYRAKVSNDMDDAMKRLAAFSVLFAPYGVIGGLMGMNVAIPGSSMTGMFWILVAGATSIAAVLFLMMKKRGWL